METKLQDNLVALPDKGNYVADRSLTESITNLICSANQIRKVFEQIFLNEFNELI